MVGKLPQALSPKLQNPQPQGLQAVVPTPEWQVDQDLHKHTKKKQWSLETFWGSSFGICSLLFWILSGLLKFVQIFWHVGGQIIQDMGKATSKGFSRIDTGSHGSYGFPSDKCHQLMVTPDHSQSQMPFTTSTSILRCSDLAVWFPSRSIYTYGMKVLIIAECSGKQTPSINGNFVTSTKLQIEVAPIWWHMQSWSLELQSNCHIQLWLFVAKSSAPAEMVQTPYRVRTDQEKIK